MKRILASILALTLAVGCMTPMTSYADAVPTITIGADLSEEQKSALFNTLGVNPTEVMVVEIDNATEREYLEGKIADDIIGTHTLSCAYILPTSTGGLVVKTSNLTWVTEGMLANALLTAGVENCQVFATAPFQVSGTGALTGVLKAYESSADVKLEEEKKDLATEELIITGELTDELAETTEETANEDELVIEFLNELKTNAVNGNLDEETAKKMLDDLLSKYKVKISEELYNRLIEYIMSFSGLKYDKDFTKRLDSLTERIKEGFNININLSLDTATDKLVTGFNGFKQFWVNLLNYIKYIFGNVDINVNVDTDAIKGNIFSTINGLKDEVEGAVNKVTEGSNEEPTVETESNVEEQSTEENPIVEEEQPTEENSIVEEEQGTPVEESVTEQPIEEIDSGDLDGLTE